MENITLPTSFRIIGFGENADLTLNQLSKFEYGGLTLSTWRKDILPRDEDKMAILLVTDNSSLAESCAKTFYQAGVLTLAICTPENVLPDECVSSQTVCTPYQMFDAVKVILDILFNKDGYICTDFNDIDTVLRDSGNFGCFSAIGSGENRIKDAIDVVDEIFTEGFTSRIENMILSLYFNKDSAHPLSMTELDSLTKYLGKLPDSMSIIWGASHDDTISDESARISLVISGRSD